MAEQNIVNKLQGMEEKLTGLQKDNVQQFQKEVLDFFRDFRTGLYDELSKFEPQSNSGSSEKQQKMENEIKRLNYRIDHLTRNFLNGATAEQNQEQQDKISKLEKENARLQYRITHLVRNLEEATNK